jgi:hypothetical protein
MPLETSTELNFLQNVATEFTYFEVSRATGQNRKRKPAIRWLIYWVRSIVCSKYKFLSFKNTFILHYQDQYLKAVGGKLMMFVARYNINKKMQFKKTPVPASRRSKAWVCRRSSAEIVGSNPAWGIDVCLL